MPAHPSRRSFLFAALALTTLGPTTASAVVAPMLPPASLIHWSLESPNTILTMAQRRSFRIWMVAHNMGRVPMDTQRDSLQWKVNGQLSMVLSMAFGNGGREVRWSRLPAGDTIREARDLGESLFPRPGRYTITLHRDAREVARLVITVR